MLFRFFFHTGALIGRRTVVTAAHCVDPARKGATLAQLKAGFVRIGGNQLTKGRQYKVSSTPQFPLITLSFSRTWQLPLVSVAVDGAPLPPGGHHPTAYDSRASWRCVTDHAASPRASGFSLSLLCFLLSVLLYVCRQASQVQGIVNHPAADVRLRPGGRWPIDLVLVYLTEAVNLKERRDVAVAQLGKPGQVKTNQMVSFAGMFRGGARPAGGGSAYGKAVARGGRQLRVPPCALL